MRPSPNTPTPPRPIRVNLAGEEHAAPDGQIWHADRAYAPGFWGCLNLPDTDVLTTPHPIANTDDPELFQSIRMGEEMAYRFHVPNGTYEVALCFAEIYWETGSAEQQDLYLQGKRVLRAFNIFDDAGHDCALVKTFKTSVAQGALEIRFVGRSLPMHSGARACAIHVKPL